jgi:type III secretion protein R
MTIMALSLVMTLITMRPVIGGMVSEIEKIDFRKLKINSVKELVVIGEPVTKPLGDFLTKHAGERELKTLLDLRQSSSTNESFDRWIDLIGAFMITELKEAFAMGFALLIPFLVIDLVVANVLVGMGLHMVTPTMISLPIKLLVLGFSGTWLKLTEALVRSYA